MNTFEPTRNGQESAPDPEIVRRSCVQSAPRKYEEQIEPTQVAMDLIDEAGMESFPCSDPPSYTRSHA